MNQALPTGCPETMMYGAHSSLLGPMLHEKGKLNYGDGLGNIDYCAKYNCTPVEIHPQGTMERMAKMEKALKYYASDLAEFSFHDKDGFLCDANTFSGKAKDALQSLTPGVTDANHD